MIKSTFHTPSRKPPRGLVVAIHGGGFDERYFQVPGYSTVQMLTDAGFAVLTLNRPGYGGSDPIAGVTPIAASASPIADLIEQTAALQGIGGPIIILGHSIGGATAIEIAALQPSWLTGITVSGIGKTCPEPVVAAWNSFRKDVPVPSNPDRDRVFFFGKDDQFDQSAFDAVQTVRAQSILAEIVEVATLWPKRFSKVAARVTVPVQIGLAEEERLWITSSAELQGIADSFVNAPVVEPVFLADGGHLYEFHHAGQRWLEAQLRFIERLARS